MFNFNLLPPKKKKAIEKERLYFLIRGVIQGLFFILIIILFLFLGVDFSLKYLISSQEEMFKMTEEDDVIKDMIKLDSQITKENKFIDKVYSVQQDLVYLASTIEEIAWLVPNGVHLTELTIERKTVGSSENGEENGEAEEGDASESSSNQETSEETEEETEEQVEKEEYFEVKIVGIADKRENVIDLKKALENEPSFTSLVAPLESVLKAKDADFEFLFKIKD